MHEDGSSGGDDTESKGAGVAGSGSTMLKLSGVNDKFLLALQEIIPQLGKGSGSTTATGEGSDAEISSDKIDALLQAMRAQLKVRVVTFTLQICFCRGERENLR